MKVPLGPILLTATFVAPLLLWLGPRIAWELQDPLPLNVLLVDYTVPRWPPREHAGAIWLLRHWKVPGPAGDWVPERDYAGWSPDAPGRPVRLAGAWEPDLDLVWVCDTYGLLEADLVTGDPDGPTPLVFGGLSGGDATRLEQQVGAGGAVLAEFNILATPTTGEGRSRGEALFGVRWTGWTSRVFADLHDDPDVPWWLERMYPEQHGEPLPEGPGMVWVHEDGRIELFRIPDLSVGVPRIAATPRGRRRLPGSRAGDALPYWFAVHRTMDGDVLASIELPELPGLERFLRDADIPRRPPLLVERRGPGLSWLFAAEFVDLDFAPGDWRRRGAARTRGRFAAALAPTTTAPAFWRFYAPAMDLFLHEVAARDRGDTAAGADSPPGGAR